jgi:DNA-binding XRE family transcriptional regulator
MQPQKTLKPDTIARNRGILRRQTLLQEVLGGSLLDLRTARGMTQRQLGDEVGCSRELIGKIEQGRALPSIRTLVALVKVLHKLL